MTTDRPLQLGMIGLGRMGANLSRRLMRDGHEVVVYDVNADAVKALEAEGATGATTLEDFVAALRPPRAAWIMVPAGDITESTVNDDRSPDVRGRHPHRRRQQLLPRRHPPGRELRERGIHYVDVGTSGGVFGLERGYCLMIGAEDEVFDHLEPIFATIASGVEAAERTPGREGEPTMDEQGYLHCGPNGAGHFVKMVHNGIEYGIMAAYAEGLNVLKNANAGTVNREKDAETAPLDHPEFYQYDIDIPAVAEVWRRGQRRRLLAARPDRLRAARVAGARRVRGQGVGLR